MVKKKYKSSSYLEDSILQLRMDQSGKGFMTVCPLGNWTGMYFSEEIKNAINTGIVFKV